jgi:hypothetical protein
MKANVTQMRNPLMSNLTKLALRWLMIAGFCFVGVTGAQATPVFGNFSASGGALGLTSTTMDFLTLPGFIPGPAPGNFVVSPSVTGSFVGRVGETATIKDIPSPMGGPISILNFIVMPNAPAITFHLTFIDFGLFTAANCGSAPAAGQVCTPPGSAFNFMNTSVNSSTLSFNVRGLTNFLATPADISQFSGVFTTQFSDMSYQAVLATLAAGGSVTSSWSASFTVVGGPAQPTPEPTTLALLGTSLVGGAAYVRKWRKRSRA